ncbi:MAG: helix-turn-helix domain-containing protein [archaeon]|nr:helix-turn-helix domain-containing protein [archaeon]
MRITSQRIKDELIKALADEYSKKIILKTINQARSVEELAQAESIPISTAYRRVNEMKENGILIVERIVITDDGKKYDLYRSAFRKLQIGLEQDEITFDVVLNEDLAERISRLWSLFRA